MLAEACIRPAVTIDGKASIRDAARLMRQKAIGALVVTGNHRPKGMITDRDIVVAVVAEGLDPAQVRVADVMSSNPAVIRGDKGIFDAVRLFAAKAVRRLPVVDNRGFVIGIIALDDVLMLLGTEMGHVATALSRSVRRRMIA
jgi:predicted transcriptional regulator